MLTMFIKHSLDRGLCLQLLGTEVSNISVKYGASDTGAKSGHACRCQAAFLGFRNIHAVCIHHQVLP